MRKLNQVIAPPIVQPKQSSLAPSVILLLLLAFLILISASYLLHPQKVSLFFEGLVEGATALVQVFFYSLMAVLVLALIAGVCFLGIWAKDRIEKTRRVYPDERGMLPVIHQHGVATDLNAMPTTSYRISKKDTGPVLDGLSYEDKQAQLEATAHRRGIQAFVALGSGGGSFSEIQALNPPDRFKSLFTQGPRVRELGPGMVDGEGKETLDEIEGKWRVADED